MPDSVSPMYSVCLDAVDDQDVISFHGGFVGVDGNGTLHAVYLDHLQPGVDGSPNGRFGYPQVA